MKESLDPGPESHYAAPMAENETDGGWWVPLRTMTREQALQIANSGQTDEPSEQDIRDDEALAESEAEYLKGPEPADESALSAAEAVFLEDDEDLVLLNTESRDYEAMYGVKDHDLVESDEVDDEDRENDWDILERCEWCGELVDCEHFDIECPNQDSVWAKGIAPGAETLDQAIAAYEGIVEYLKVRKADGWELTQPEDNGHLFLGKRATVTQPAES